MRSNRFVYLAAILMLLGGGQASAQNSSQSSQGRGLFQVLQDNLNISLPGVGGNSSQGSQGRPPAHPVTHAGRPTPASSAARTSQRATAAANEGNTTTNGHAPPQGAAMMRPTADPAINTPTARPMTVQPNMQPAVANSAPRTIATPYAANVPGGAAPLPLGVTVGTTATPSASDRTKLHQRLSAFQNSAFGDTPSPSPSTMIATPSATPRTTTITPSAAQPMLGGAPSAVTPTPALVVPSMTPRPSLTELPSAPAMESMPAPRFTPSAAVGSRTFGMATTGPATSVTRTPSAILSPGMSAIGGAPGSAASDASSILADINLSPKDDDVRAGDASSNDTSPLAAPISSLISGVAEPTRPDATAPVASSVREIIGAPNESAPPESPRVDASPIVSPRTTESQRPSVATTTPVVRPVTPPTTAAPSDSDVLIVHHSPSLSVETLGPRSIAVGKESAYRVNITNSGSVAAHRVVVSVDLPPWADVMGAEMSTGATGSNVTGDNTTQLLWKIDRIDAMGREQLVVRIVPRERRPFDMKVKWDFSELASQAMIEVQEPIIELALEGPEEVLWGAQQVFKLHIRNTGNGDATNVNLELSPIGDPNGPKNQHTIPLVKAGGEEVVNIALRAAQTGFITIDVAASGDSVESVALSERIAVLRAALDVVVEAPELRFVGNQATYAVRVRNNGSAPASGVEVTANLPLNAKYVSNVGGGRPDPAQRKITWRLDELTQGGERTFSVLCDLTSEGVSRLDVLATAEGGLTAAAGGVCRVDAIADLSLDITDPTGPVAIGEETEYSLVIQNNGTKHARDVKIVAYFSAGIEPIAVDGAQHSLSAGQVAIEPIASIEPNGSKKIRIRAKAEAPGNHLIRVQVESATGIRLSGEEMTFFYNPKAMTGSGGPRTMMAAEGGEGYAPPMAENLESPAPYAPPESLPDSSAPANENANGGSDVEQQAYEPLQPAVR